MSGRTSRRTFLSVGAVGTLGAIVLAACGQPAAPAAPATPTASGSVAAAVPPTSTPVPTSAPAQLTPTPVPAAPASSSVSLKFMMRGGSNDPLWKAVFDRWKADRPNVAITIDDAQSWDKLQVKLLAEIAAGSPPDTFFPDVNLVNAFIRQDALLGLEDLIKADKTFKLDDIWPVSLDGFRYPNPPNGKLYGLPWDFGMNCLAYNKNLLQKAGIPEPAQDVSLDFLADIVPMASKLTLDFNGKNPEDPKFDPQRIQQYGIEPWNYDLWWYIRTAGGSMFNADYTKVTVNDPASVEGLQFLYDLQNKYKVAGSPTYKQSQPLSFETGKVALEIFPTWNVAGTVRQANFDWDLAPLPHLKTRVSDGRASGMAILAGSKAVDPSWEWVKFLSVGPGQDIKAASGDSIHSLKAKASDPQYVKRKTAPIHWADFLKESEVGGEPYYSKYWDIFIVMAINEMGKTYSGDVTVKQAADSITQKGNYLLANGRLP